MTLRSSAPPKVLPEVWAYGDPDDHLRVTVLLAEELRDVDVALVQACQRANAPWATRLDALGDLIRMAARMGRIQPWVRVVDPDALDVRIREDQWWDDTEFGLPRRALLDLVLDGAERNVLALLRPSPRGLVSARLTRARFVDLPLGLDATARSPVLRDLLARLPPDVRLTARWLLAHDALGEVELASLIDEAPHRERAAQHLVALAYDVSPERVRRLGRLLSTVREVVKSNGTLGPFGWSGDANPGDVPIPTAMLPTRQDVDALVERGFLSVYAGRGSTTIHAMPRRVRDHLRMHAEALDKEAVHTTHEALARGGDPATEEPARVCERHHHAVAAGETDLALATARFYGADLRAIAYRLSFERRYDEAAKVYQKILADFDATDAYAWEYLGYNLLRASGGSPTADQLTQARDAYEKAANLDEFNPLYRGRDLGMRARLGHDVSDEATRTFEMLSARHRDDPGAMRFFLEVVFDGIQRAGNPPWGVALKTLWQPVFDALPPRRERRHSL